MNDLIGKMVPEGEQGSNLRNYYYDISKFVVAVWD